MKNESSPVSLALYFVLSHIYIDLTSSIVTKTARI